MTGFIRFEWALKHPRACSGVLQLRIVSVISEGGGGDIDEEEDDDEDENVVEVNEG